MEPEVRADAPGFASFLASAEPRLRRALVARYGLEVGRDACADAVAYAWEHQARLRSMGNPVGYLYRVGQSSVRRQHRRARRVVLPPERPYEMVDPEPGLPAALAGLTSDQRVAKCTNARGGPGAFCPT